MKLHTYIYSAVESVLQRTHQLDGATLQVKLYDPLKSIPIYPNRVLILNLNPETTKDGIINYLEAKTGDEVADVAFGQEEGTVLVTFKELTGLFCFVFFARCCTLLYWCENSKVDSELLYKLHCYGL